MKPKILIVGEEGFQQNIGHFLISRKYADSVSVSGGLPLLALDALHPTDYLDIVDGLLLTGGPDIHKGRSGEIYQIGEDISHIARSRESFEFELCRLFANAGKPILGIGRGMQVLNAYFGGSLYMDISESTNHTHSADNAPSSENSKLSFHTVSFTSESRLPFASDDVTVNSCHHQAVKILGEGLIVSAFSPDGVIEAYQHKSLPVYGFQFHPERARGDFPDPVHAEKMDKLFKEFINMCS